MNDLYYVFAMGDTKRYKAKVYTESEAKKLKGQVVVCGASFHLKAHTYGLLSCKPEDYAHWIEYAKKNNGKLIKWENGKLCAPNGKVIATKAAAALANWQAGNEEAKQ